ncbi:hypothetical protein Mfer_0937 [Methanothermus fervidus DSM 2088]|uniref:Uncharacterized protein n=1 Tax=Methanothermus fervidus (strain ATCC 43054 / DSM 2088 / JCM 10308 / V24 S) TaxID=523846 RepID=E3GZK3_METFV|nr:hypothetical protein [Methanothermus fervidus]ADP77735.1 hypothetical protein Mfer_0937 [Methanothermus fervidus DSM 2088]
MVSRLKLLEVTFCILGILFIFFITLDWIVESRPNLLPWAKTHMFVILLGVCVTSALAGIYLAFLSLYWGKYGSKIFKSVERGDLAYYCFRFIMPLGYFMLSLDYLEKIGELTRQAWLVNIYHVGQDILLTIAIMGVILYFILRRLGKIPHR